MRLQFNTLSTNLQCSRLNLEHCSGADKRPTAPYLVPNGFPGILELLRLEHDALGEDTLACSQTHDRQIHRPISNMFLVVVGFHALFHRLSRMSYGSNVT